MGVVFGGGVFGGSGGDGGSGILPVTILGSEIVYAAFRKINVLGQAGRGYSPSQGNDGLKVLNRMLASWNTEKLAIWAELRDVHNLTINQQDYEIGPGAADFDMLRPLRIDRASIIMNPLSAQPLEIPIATLTFQQWQNITVKPLPTPLPQGVYYETSFPVGVLHFWPYPTELVQVVLYIAQQIVQIPTLDTEYSIPDGYARAIIHNLAVEMADDYPRATLKPMTVQIAADSKAWIKRLNIRPMDIQCDRGCLRDGAGYTGRWNNYTGQFNP